MRKAGIGLAAAAALVAGCAERPKPAPPPAAVPLPPTPAPEPPPPPLAWEDLPVAPGAWVYSADDAGSQALFGAPASEASFVVRCERAPREVVLSREGSPASPQLRVRTSSLERTLAATARTEPLAYVGAALPAGDPLLDAIAFSRGRFAVEVPGLPLLVLPAWPEPGRVVEDCRG